MANENESAQFTMPTDIFTRHCKHCGRDFEMGINVCRHPALQLNSLNVPYDDVFEGGRVAICQTCFVAKELAARATANLKEA